MPTSHPRLFPQAGLAGIRRLLLAFVGLAVVALTSPTVAPAQESITYRGDPGELVIFRVSTRTVQLQLSALDAKGTPLQAPPSEVMVEHPRTEIWRGRTLPAPGRPEVLEPAETGLAGVVLELSGEPLSLTLRRVESGDVVQSLSWGPSVPGEAFRFRTPAPVFGLGHGGPQFDRRGHLLPMRDGWGAYQRPTHGSRVAAPMLVGSDGWSVFVHHPIHPDNAFDLRGGEGRFVPTSDPDFPVLDLYLTAWHEPAQALEEYRLIAGSTPMPPRWALGYMQSHRTLEDENQLLRVARNFRDRRLPIDAVIYLGTGFTPAGWNLGHGNFDFNPAVFQDEATTFRELQALNLNVVLHTYAPPVGLHGMSMDEPSDSTTHIGNYWRNHEAAMALGVTGWWPDGGENLSSASRLARQRMYRLGPLHTRPNVRPWSFHRTGASGSHRYGGWIWSGDPDSYWETLRTQIAVGLNHVVSLTPYWGVDTGGFLPSEELTGELYIRWFQFSAFTASFRSHGRGWHTRLPWGWNTADPGPPEVDRFSDAFERGYPHIGELRNGLVEPIAREFLHLRYRLLPYNYTLTRETHDSGLPPMRALWLHYPQDSVAVRLGDQYLWGRDLMVAPVHEKGASSRRVYLPQGVWYDWWTQEAHHGPGWMTRQVDLATLPLFARAGAIIPLDPVRQYANEPVRAPTTLRVYTGKSGVYRWYRDDGVSLDHQRGAYSWIRARWDDAARLLTVEADPSSGGIPPDPEVFHVELLPEGGFARMEWDGRFGEIHFPLAGGHP